MLHGLYLLEIRHIDNKYDSAMLRVFWRATGLMEKIYHRLDLVILDTNHQRHISMLIKKPPVLATRVTR
jgi:hypothetical protein